MVKTRGLTLIEMLVTLVLVAIISTVIMQGMGYIWGIQNRYNQIINQSAEQNMRLGWWRDSITGLLTQLPNDPKVFHADEHEFEGQSLNALGYPIGLPAPMRWQITTHSGKTELVGNGQAILALPAGSTFAYLDADRKQHDHWPLAQLHSQQFTNPQLPEVIVIHQGEQIVWAASPQQPQVPKTPPGGVFGQPIAP